MMRARLWLEAMLKRLIPGLKANETRFALAHVFEHLGDDDDDDEEPRREDEDVGERHEPPRGTVTFAAFNDAIRAFRGGVSVETRPSRGVVVMKS